MTDKKNHIQKKQGPDGSIMKQVVVNAGPNSAIVSMLSPDAGTQPSKPSHSDEDTDATYQPWGENNDWPTVAREKTEKSTTAFPLIARMVALMFGRGIVYYREVRDGDKITQDFTPIPEIDDFLQQNNIDFLMLDRLMDYKMFGNTFCEFILNKGKNNITNIYHMEAEFSRFGTIDKTSKKILNVRYTGNWDDPDAAEDIPFLMRRDHSKEQALKIGSSKKKFCIHSALPSPGRTLYAMPPHGGLFRKNGWLDFSNSIPEILSALNTNGFAIRFHIQIPYEYWPSMYKDWDSYDQDKRDDIIDAKITQMTDWLSGADNAGKSFISHFSTDPVNGKPLAGFKIEALEDKIKKDQFITSTNEADAQIARAIGVDISMAGIQAQGGKMGAGSGSDKRIGFTNMVSLSYMDQIVITEPLKLVQKINGWDPDVKFAFVHDLPTTLNETSSGVTSNV